eukprot:TRINITY_DN17705_c0_g1_i11.p1 TRINITY_DN17705_c0_g1~~TRINITY_DN17705_c0_g1_i11.p1  ORF type:complete len:360 (-),score=70.23 TRINITY_DN17705_c0_g1_i11:279-1358(-)
MQLSRKINTIKQRFQSTLPLNHQQSLRPRRVVIKILQASIQQNKLKRESVITNVQSVEADPKIDMQQVKLPSVTIVGVGLMGNKVARRLKQVGFPVTAWNRNIEKAKALQQLQISVIENLEDAISESEIVLLLLSDAAAIQQTVLDEKITKQLQGKMVVQMGTIGPNQAKEICKQVEAAGAEFMEAPVLGSQPEALKGTLLVMVGSKTPPDQSKAWPLLKALGESPLHMGDVGTAAATKLALNQLIASLTIGFSTSLTLLQKEDVNIEKFMDILRPSALYAPTFDKKLQRMLDEDYSNPNFPTKHLLKDIRLFNEVAQQAGVDPSLLEGLQKVIERTVERGLDNTDYSAVHDAVSKPSK